MTKPVVTVVGLPSFIDDACTESEYSLDEQYPDGNAIHVAHAQNTPFGCFGDPAVVAEVRERLHRCTTLDEIEQLLQEIDNEAYR